MALTVFVFLFGSDDDLEPVLHCKTGWFIARCPQLVYCALDSFPLTLDNSELRSTLSDEVLQ